MSNPANSLIDFIKTRYPELSGEHIYENKQGWSNRVFVIGDRLIFRFPRTEKEKTSMKLELRILPKLKKALPVDIPDFIYSSSDSDEIRYVGYKMIPGIPLKDIKCLSAAQRTLMAENLGRFLTALHTFPADSDFPPAELKPEYTKIYWENFYEGIKEKIFPVISSMEKAKVESLFEGFIMNPENFVFKCSLIHGDLDSKHILHDPVNKHLSGIIDFGSMKVGDPAYDFTGIYKSYGKDFFKKVLQSYRVPMDKAFYDRICNFYVKSIMFETLLYALETKNDKVIKVYLKYLQDL
ncbi:aminoglycoside phosphotransferase family protein [Bacillus sp. JJ1521]|uniref:phosphotransferase family protein n=1 Tax=Bacillus sp. JJ1521 TaxID=3122957 RepID=UPI002FFE2BF8